MKTHVQIRPHGTLTVATVPMPRCVVCGNEFKVGSNVGWVQFGKESDEGDRILVVILWEGPVCDACNRSLAGRKGSA